MQAFDCVLFDTEFTAWQGSKERKWSQNWEHRELIQLAAMRVHIQADSLKIISSFNELIRPTVNPILSDYIVALTGIEQSVVDEMGVDFQSALTQFYQFCDKGYLPIWSWGNDIAVLEENCQLYHLSMPDFFAGVGNLQTLAKAMQLTGCQGPSGQLAQANGVELAGHPHNALFDVRSLAASANVWLGEAGEELGKHLFSPGC